MAAAVCAAPACANVRQSSNAGHQNVSGINFSAGSARPGALSERARRVAARRAAVTQAVLTPPVGHEEVRPSTILRPVSAAAVDSSKALEQFRSMGGASRYASEAKSSIMSIGLSIHTCPVEIREKLAVPEDKWEEAVAQLCSYPHVEEAGILSTCNRLEIYVVGLSWHRGVREVEEWMSQYSGIPLEELREHLFLLRDRDATSHLLKVSGGLDSVVMGEGQILAQVKNTFALGENVEGFGRHLSGLFKAAITAGKRVRSETSIASGAVSVSSAAAELVQMKLPSNSFDDCRVMIVGAGTMSRLLVKHLVSKRCTEMTIVNRSRGRVEELQADFPEANIKICLMDEFHAEAANHDVIFTAASTGIIITKDDLAKMKPAGSCVAGSRRLVDIAVPRNVDGNCAEDENTICYNVDDLKELVELNKDKRLKAADEARDLLAHEQASFEAWRDSLETVPTIKKLRGKAEAIRMAELDKATQKLGEGMTKKQLKIVEELSRGIVNKLLHGPMQALRSDGTDPSEVGETLVNMHALEKMFDLKNQDVPTRGGAGRR
mmetsp:Transcript_33283/g.53288  ORF Transcript_33283/g.53288 Transcript_33283/m.53288 type:complete len:550 (-) Transcript_33283:306-1955(-)